MVATPTATSTYDSHIIRAMSNNHSIRTARTASNSNIVVYHHRHNEQQIANFWTQSRRPTDRWGGRLPLPHGTLPSNAWQVHLWGKWRVLDGHCRLPGRGLRFHRHHVRVLLIILAGQCFEEGDIEIFR